MFTKKDEKYTLDDLCRDLEAAGIKARAARLNAHGVENALEQQIRIQRGYIAASLKF